MGSIAIIAIVTSNSDEINWLNDLYSDIFSLDFRGLFIL